MLPLPELEEKQIQLRLQRERGLGARCELEGCAAWLGRTACQCLCSSSSMEPRVHKCLEGTPVLYTTFLHPEWQHGTPAPSDSCGLRENRCTF